jgi:protein ImuB
VARGEERRAPRVVALHFPDLPLQRILRAREAAGSRLGRRTPIAIESGGRIACRDAEARAHGVAIGDGLLQAQAACSDLEIVSMDDGADSALLESLAEAMLAIAPTVEIAWPDSLLLDASGAQLFADGTGDGEAALVDRALALARDMGLQGRAAIANGRAPARALARHGAALRADRAASGAVLAQLPLDVLGLDPQLARRLSALGLRTAGELARIPAETLAHRFGASGIEAWRIASGDDPSPLVPHAPVRLPEESLDFEAPVESTDPLLFALKRLCDRAALRLAGRHLGATRLGLVLRLDPSGDERIEIGLAAPSSSSSRWLLVVRERVGALRLPAPVVAATLTVAEASTAPVEQFALDDRPEQMIAIETVLARLAARLGDEAVFAAEPADRYRPESAYGVRPFLDPGSSVAARSPATCSGAGLDDAGGRRGRKAKPGRRGARSGHRDASASDVPDTESSAPARPTRLLPRPEPLVALGEGGRLAAVRLGGRTLRVLALSTAERLAGEWWSEPFDRDYHRVRLEWLGECWLFRDARDGRLWLHGFFD